MKNKILFFLKYYLPAFIWAGVIFYFSSIPGLQHGSVSTVEEIILRKGAHFVEYAVMAFLLWRIFYGGHTFDARPSFWLALFISAVYAASDELHQHFVFARTGKGIDVLFDSLSALFALEILWVASRRKLKWQNAMVVVFSLVGLLALELIMIREVTTQKTAPSVYENNIQEDEPGLVINEPETHEPQAEETPEPELSGEIPKRIAISVPFTSQAPYANWDEIHEEACEEASLVMVRYFLTGKGLDKGTAEKEILDLVEFQTKKYGNYKDTDVEETIRLAEDFYGLDNLRAVYDFGPEDLKKHLADGRPVMVPAAGRLLGNPNFTYPGPLYHMLVLTGYDGDTIITNDPGTRKGEGYKYDINVLFEAIHDFPGDKNKIESGRKAMIVLR